MILFIIVWIGLTVFFFIKMNKSARKLHSEIDEIEELAKQSKTSEQCLEAWEQLKVVSEKSFHRSYGERIREIKAILQTKYEIFSNHDKP